MSVAVSSYSAPVALSRTSPATACLSRGAAGPARVSALLRRHATLPSRGRGAALVVRAAEEQAAEMVGSDASKLTTSLPSVLDINEIMNRLPHRFPFLLVDRIIEYVPGKYAIGIKNVTINDNFFPGHFPTRPLMPGVLQVEAMAQVGGLVMLTPEVGGSKDSFFFGGVDACRFRRPVLPGDVLVMKVELIKLNKRFGMAKMKAQAFVGDKMCCEAELTMVLGTDTSK